MSRTILSGLCIHTFLAWVSVPTKRFYLASIAHQVIERCRLSTALRWLVSNGKDGEQEEGSSWKIKVVCCLLQKWAEPGRSFSVYVLIQVDLRKLEWKFTQAFICQTVCSVQAGVEIHTSLQSFVRLCLVQAGMEIHTNLQLSDCVFSWILGITSVCAEAKSQGLVTMPIAGVCF